METNERVREMVEVMAAARLLDDFVKLPPVITNSQFDSVEERNKAFADATETMLAFVMEQIERVAASDVIDLAGEITMVREDRDRLAREVSRLEKRMEKAAPDGVQKSPDPPPAGSTTPGRKGNLPKFVKREGGRFSCCVRRQGLNIYKGGFETAQAAYEYAVGRIAAGGGDATLGKRTSYRAGVDRALPRFVYKRAGRYNVLCNRTKIKFNRRGFKTAAEASEWAEAEFARHEAGLSQSPDAASGQASRGDPGRQWTPAEIKAAIEESKRRRHGPVRRWVECAGCGYELGIPGEPKPDLCPKCGSGARAIMEGRDGGDAEEVRE